MLARVTPAREFHYGTKSRNGITTTRFGVKPPYNSLYEETPPERGTFFRLQVYERVRILLVEVFERVGKSCHLFGSVKGAKGPNRLPARRPLLTGHVCTQATKQMNLENSWKIIPI